MSVYLILFVFLSFCEKIHIYYKQVDCFQGFQISQHYI